MAGLKIKLDKESYEIDMGKVTLGEGRFLKKHFGMTSYEELTIIDPDPDVLVGILAIAIKRKHPELDDEAIIAKVEALPQADFFVPMLKSLEAEAKKVQEAAVDPRSAGANDSQPANGSSGTTPKTRGAKPSANAA